MQIALYKLGKDDTRLASDPALQRLCVFSVPVGGAGKPTSERGVTVALRFAQANIVISATDDTTGDTVRGSDVQWDNVL